jgi:hypothetical protein
MPFVAYMKERFAMPNTFRNSTHLFYLVIITMLAISLAGRAEVPGAAAQTTTAAAPSLISYQGILRNNEGRPLNGSYDVTFRIYNQVTDQVSQRLWEELHTGVTVRDGLFTVLLGNITSFNAGLFSDPDQYIGVQVAGFDEMQPRQRFAAVPYAVAAVQADVAKVANTANSVAAGNVRGKVSSAANADSAGFATNAGYAGQAGSLYHNGQQITYLNNGELGVYGNITAYRNGKYLTLRTDGSAVDIQAANADLFINSPYRILLNANTQIELNSSAIRVNGNKPLVRNIRIETIPHNEYAFTGVLASEYNCVATGWYAYYDVQENNAGYHIVQTSVSGGYWYVLVRFWSHNVNESPTVDVTCFHRNISTWETLDP